MKPKVLIITPDLSESHGIARYSLLLIQYLKSLNYPHVHIEIPKIELKLGHMNVGGIFLNMSYSFLKSILMPKHNYIVHITTHTIPSFIGDVMTLHDIIPIKYGKSLHDKLIAKNIDFMCRRVKIICVSSKYVYNDIKKYLSIYSTKTRIVRHPVDIDTFHPDKKLNNKLDKIFRKSSSNKINVILVGDFNPRKKYEIPLTALSERKDVNIIHIGSHKNWPKRWRDLTKKFGKRITFLGYVPDDVLRKCYSNADFFISASVEEGFGLPPLEAMACGTNVIVSDIPPHRENIGKYGFFYNLNDVESFKETFEYALDHKIPSEMLVKYVRANFSPLQHAKKMIELYEDMESNKKRKTRI